MDINNHINQLRDEALARRLLKIILFVAFPAYIVHSCVTSPLFTFFYNDVGLRDFAIIFNILNGIIDLFVFFLSYAVVIYGLYRLSLDKIKHTFYLSLFAPAFKYALKLIVSIVGYSKIDINQILEGLYSFGISCTLEMLQFLAIIFISKSYIDKYKQMENIANKASRVSGASSAADLSVVPFKRILSIKNPLQRGALVSACVVSALRIVMLAINDTSKGIYAVDFVGYMILIGGYLLELVIGVIGYMFMLYLYITLATKDNTVN